MPEITRRAPYVVNLLCIAVAAAVVFLPLDSSASEGCEGADCAPATVEDAPTELVGPPPVPTGPTAAGEVAVVAEAAPAEVVRSDVAPALPTVEDDDGPGGGDVPIDRVQLVLAVCGVAALGAAAFGRRPAPRHTSASPA